MIRFLKNKLTVFLLSLAALTTTASAREVVKVYNRTDSYGKGTKTYVINENRQSDFLPVRSPRRYYNSNPTTIITEVTEETTTIEEERTVTFYGNDDFYPPQGRVAPIENDVILESVQENNPTNVVSEVQDVVVEPPAQIPASVTNALPASVTNTLEGVTTDEKLEQETNTVAGVVIPMAQETDTKSQQAPEKEESKFLSLFSGFLLFFSGFAAAKALQKKDRKEKPVNETPKDKKPENETPVKEEPKEKEVVIEQPPKEVVHKPIRKLKLNTPVKPLSPDQLRKQGIKLAADLRQELLSIETLSWHDVQVKMQPLHETMLPPMREKIENGVREDRSEQAERLRSIRLLEEIKADRRILSERMKLAVKANNEVEKADIVARRKELALKRREIFARMTAPYSDNIKEERRLLSKDMRLLAKKMARATTDEDAAKIQSQADNIIQRRFLLKQQEKELQIFVSQIRYTRERKSFMKQETLDRIHQHRLEDRRERRRLRDAEKRQEHVVSQDISEKILLAKKHHHQFRFTADARSMIRA